MVEFAPKVPLVEGQGTLATMEVIGTNEHDVARNLEGRVCFKDVKKES